MKKTTLKFAALALLGLSNLALADAASELQMRLAKVDVLSAEFVQTVTWKWQKCSTRKWKTSN